MKYNTKRVSIFLRAPDMGGWSIERVFNDVVAAMPREFPAHLLYCPYKSQGVWKRVKALIWAWKHRSDINHISGDIHFIALMLPKRNTILTIHDCGELRKQRGLKKFLLRLFWFQMPVAKAAIVTTISQRTRRDLLDIVRCDPKRVRVVPNPVSAVFRPSERPFYAEKPRLLQVGTKWNKNLERVVDAITGLSCTLVIIGRLSSDQESRLREQQIDFENYVNLSEAKLVKAYQGADIVVFASLFEGFGLPAVEGQTVGRPVITSIGPPFDEVVGDSACLVDPIRVDSIRQGIVKVIKNESFRNELIRKGFENAERFDPKRIAAEYCEIYNEISGVIAPVIEDGGLVR